MLKLHLGCGNTIIKKWVNIDKYNPGADCQDDMITLPSYKIGEVDEIYTSHAIEHISPEDFKKALFRWHQLLKPSGKLTLRCPNAESYLKLWLEVSDKEKFSKPDYRNCILGFQNNDGMYNRNLLTTGLLTLYLQEAKFKVIECKLVSVRNYKMLGKLKGYGIDEGNIYSEFPVRDIWCQSFKI